MLSETANEKENVTDAGWLKTLIAKEQHVILDCESVFVGKTDLTNTFVIGDHCVETCAQCEKTQALSSTTPDWLIKASYYKIKVPNISINQGFATVFVITEQPHMLDQSITCKTQADEWKCLQKIQRHLPEKKKRRPLIAVQFACFLRQVSIETHFLCLNLVTQCNWFLIAANVNCDSKAAKIFLLVGRLGYRGKRRRCCLCELSKLLEDAGWGGGAEVFCRFHSWGRLVTSTNLIWTCECYKLLPWLWQHFVCDNI